MMKSKDTCSSLLSADLFKGFRRYQLTFACLVIALCFALANDAYAAKAIVLKNKDLFPGKKRVINYLDATKRTTTWALLRSDLKRRYLINPNRTQQQNIIKAFAGGNTCGNGATPIFALPYTDAAGTTVGKVDDYNLADLAILTGCPSCSGFTVGTTGAASGSGPFSSPTRGTVFAGTGTGEDAAYRIVFGTTSNISINMQPTTAVDMAVILYGPTCSNLATDAIAVSNWGYAGDNESITVASMPAGTYNIVVDGYSFMGGPAASSPYTLNVTGSAPTAAGVTVAGRVTTARGGGLVNALVSLTDQNGVVKYVRTVSSGAYQFDDVETGHTYIIAVFSRRFQFDNPTSVISLTDAISDLNFTAVPRRH